MLPVIISWNVWNVRNLCIFEDCILDLDCIYLHIIQLIEELSFQTIAVTKHRYLKTIQHNDADGYLDGETKDGFYAVGVSLFINNNHIFKFKLHCGKGSNMKELQLQLPSQKNS